MPNTTENTIRNALRTVLDLKSASMWSIWADLRRRRCRTDGDHSHDHDDAKLPHGQAAAGRVYAAAQAALGAGWQLDVQLVWQPAWTPQCMSAAARTHFGWEPGL